MNGFSVVLHKKPTSVDIESTALLWKYDLSATILEYLQQKMKSLVLFLTLLDRLNVCFAL